MNLVPTPPARRAAATTVDCLLVAAPYFLALSGSSPDPVRVAAAAAVLLLMTAQAWLLARRGQTIGKILLRHRVARRATGENAGFLVAAVARPLVSWAPNLLCLYFRAFPVWVVADALVMNWRADGLSLHDLLCGTRVVEAEGPAS
ncbi:MAG TPA: RDD family protein [Elusimicrobiota bacterium]|nr:RDD family protein [Elusimicrobiota bacterium]